MHFCFMFNSLSFLFSLKHLPFLQSPLQSNVVIFITLLVVILLVVGLGYWEVTQLFDLFKGEPSAKKPRIKKQPPAPIEKEINKDKLEQKAPAPSPAGNAEWVKNDYPDALLMDAQTLVKEYQTGRRNFQNIYPSAVAPYDTYLKWTVLDGVDLSRAMLYRAPFDGTSLLEANFSGAYLEGVSFRGAILRRANLSWADLTGADLSGADLTGANLSYASLQGVDLTKARLNGAIISSEQLESARSLKDAILPDGRKAE